MCREFSSHAGVYTLNLGGTLSSVAVYCDMVVDGGIGYAIIFQKYFQGSQLGPLPAEMASTVSTGTPSHNANFFVAPGETRPRNASF